MPKYNRSSRPRKRRSQVPASLLLTLLAPLSLMALSGCDQLTPQEIAELMSAIQGRRDSGSQTPSFDNSDPGSMPQFVRPSIPDFNRNPALDAGEGADNSPNDAAKTIAEADLIQREGDRLYALSEYGGLTIIDMSNPDKIRSMGHYNLIANAFEMYVNQGIVTLMVRNALSVEVDAQDGHIVEERRHSSLLTLDATNPSSIVELTQYSVPGRILDSRIVGPTLFVMSHEHNACWGCTQDPTVQVSSFNVQDPKTPVALTKLQIDLPQYSWGLQPSLMSTSEHLYVAINDRRGQEGALTTIQAIDISNPQAMKAAASIAVAGSIRSRWQMNEHKDVLRVVTQVAGTLEAPIVQTFSVQDLDAPTALGSLTMTLPRPEQLQAVRFDQDRGYAITFERTDPLFTLDLSNPASPKQMGELEIPGWVFHMEPRGDRLLGIGYDRNHPDGSLNASLFDVSDMRKPTMLSRVHFGGRWARFPEKQNQIHKAFKIWEDQGLLAVPYTGWAQSTERVQTQDGDTIECKQSRQLNGVTLVDWNQDTLTLRGDAPTQGPAKRSLLHNGRLLAVSTDNVHSYDISNRDKPQELSTVRTSMNVQDLIPLSGDLWLRRRRLNEANALEIDIVKEGQVDTHERVSTIRHRLARTGGCGARGHYGRFFVEGQTLFVETHTQEGWGKNFKNLRYLLTFDLSDPQNPVFLHANPVATRQGHLDFRVGSLAVGGDEFLVQNNLLFHARSLRRTWKAPGTVESEVIVYRIDKGVLTEQSRLRRPTARYAGRLSRTADGVVSSWYAVPSDNKDPSKIRFYWQRFYTNSESTISRTLEVPGLPILASNEGNALLTVGFQKQTRSVKDQKECFELRDAHHFDHQLKRCTQMQHTLHRLSLLTTPPTLVGSEPLLDKPGYIRQFVKSRSRVAFQVGPRAPFWPGPGLPGPRPIKPAVDTQDEPVRPAPVEERTTHLLSIGEASNLRRTTLPKRQGSYGGTLSFLRDTQLFRHENRRAELFDLGQLPKLQSIPYTPNTVRWGCHNANLTDNGDILCVAGFKGIRRLKPLARDR